MRSGNGSRWPGWVLAEHGTAPCEEGDPELWWPVRGDSLEAVAGCEVCPARAECLAGGDHMASEPSLSGSTPAGCDLGLYAADLP